MLYVQSGQAYLPQDIGLSMMIMSVCCDKYVHSVNIGGRLSCPLQHSESHRDVLQHS